MTPILAVRGLTWQPDRRPVLGPVDLDVLRGECLAVVGPNGAGKTTLLRCLTGLLRPTAGELRYEGRSFSTLSRRELARRIAYVPQIRPASVPLSVEEVVARAPDVILELRYEEISPDVTRQLVADWNQLGNVPAVLRKRVHVLAGDYTVIPGPRLPRLYAEMRAALAR